MLFKIPVTTIGLIAVAVASEAPQLPNIEECPLGHKNLKKVSISYGLIIPNDKIKKAIEDKDVFLGGCCIYPDSPKEVLVCQVCKYDYKLSHGDKPNEGTWSRTTQNPKDYIVPLSNLATSFAPPSGSQVVKPIKYTQGLSLALKPKMEACSWAVSSTDERAKAHIENWLKMQKISPKIEVSEFTRMNGDKVKRIEWSRYSSKEASVYISLELDETHNESRANISIFHKVS